MRSKIKYILLLMLVVGVFGVADAQRIRGGIAVGFNMSQVDGDEVYGFKKFGLQAGAVGILPLKNNFLFSLETIYNQKGAYQNDKSFYYEQYRLRLDYVEVPFLIHYNDRDIFTIGTGFSWAQLINVEEWEHGEKTPTSLIGPNAVYDRGDLSVLADLRFRVYGKLKVNVRYSYSVMKIRTRTYIGDYQNEWTRDQYNNLITFRLLYVINDPYKRQPKSKKEDQ